MHKVKNISQSSIYPVAGECKPGDSCEVTATEFVLLRSNHRIELVAEPAPEPAPKPAPKKAAKGPAKGPAATESFL